MALLRSEAGASSVSPLLSFIAVFVGGHGEDIGRDVSPKTTLALSCISALCAVAIFRV